MSVEINDLENTEIDTTYIDDIKSSRIEDFYIDNIVNIPLIKGEKGDKGDKGDKPVVGVDYYTEAEKTEFKNAVIQDSKTDIDEYTSSKKNEYNDNAIEKIQKYNSNAISKTETFNTNAQNKIDKYNTNAESLINRIAGVESKNTEQDTNIANKVDKEAGKGLSSNDYTDAEKEKLASLSNYNDTEIKADITGIKSTDTEQDKKIAELENENIKLRNQIPSGTTNGNAIHIEDSSDLELKWKLNGGHKQETRSGRNLYDIKNVGDRTIPPEISIDDDDWITVTADNSSGTSGKYVNYFTKNLNLKPNTQYSLIAEFKKCTGDDSVSLSLVNNGNNEGQVNSTHSLKISSIKENNTKKSKFIITTKADLSNTKNGLRTYVSIPAGTSVIITFRLSVIEDTSVVLDNFKYEKYGVSPSPDYPSEIETVSGSVKIDVVNNNLSDFNVTQDGKVKVNEDGTITINGNGGFSLSFRKFIVKANTKYYLRWELISGTVSGANIFMNPILKKGWINKDTFVESSVTEDSEISGIWINGGAVFSNAKIKIWISKSQNDFTKHQSQTVTMPAQQEMLEGDYIDDVEHHEWKKIILTGEETIIYYNAPSTEIANNLDTAYFTIGISEKAQGNSNNIISNMFKNLYTASAVWGNISSTSESLKESIAVDASIRLRINKNRLQGYDNSQTSNEKVALLKTYLKSLYDAGTPVILYYKTATPFDLELTTEQKAIREQKLHTYKNVTNISLSNDLSSVDVSYKKDVETITKNCVQKEDGKELSSNNYTNAEKEKLTNIEENAEVNIIESIKKNGVALKVKDKAIDIVVPTKISELSNDSSFQTKDEVSTSIKSAINLTWESDL